MAGERIREGQELSRRLRDELERIRDAEGRVEEALETVRQARRRVEVVARELGREEERVRALVREELRAASAAGGGPGSGPQRGPGEPASDPAAPTDEAGARSWRSDAPLGWSTWREAPAQVRDAGAPVAARPAAEPTGIPSEPAPGPDSPGPIPIDERRLAALEGAAAPAADHSVWWTRGAVGAFAALAVVLIGWFAIRGLGTESDSAPATVEAPATPGPAPTRAEPTPSTEAPAPPAPAATAPSVLTELPADATARQTLYDSLFAARSPFFDPLLAQLEAESDERGVQRAITAWRAGPVDAQDADLVHSALLQRVLKAAVDPGIEIDGQVLRNPCRGRSCSALLNAWEQRRETYGLPPVPENAPTDPRALRQAEAALVLSWLREANAAAAPAP